MLIVFYVYYLANLIGNRANPTRIVEADDNDFYETTMFEFMGELKKHPCDRQCNKNDTRRVCHYVFVVELHSTLGKVMSCFIFHSCTLV